MLGGAAPPIIKLACCAGGPCLRGRRGSFLHSVDSSECREASSELSYSPSSLVISATHPSRRCDLHTRAVSGRAGGGGKQQQQQLQRHLPNPPPSPPPPSFPAQPRTSSLLPPTPPPPPSCATVSTWPSPTGTPPRQGRVGITLSALFSLPLSL